MAEFAHLKDIVGQLPFLKTYSHLLLAFPLQNDHDSRTEAIETLKTATLKLTETFPWLAAKVVNKTGKPGDSGSFELESCTQWSAPNTILRVRDCSDICPSYDELVKARGPVTMLDGSVLAPRKAFPESYQETEADPAPVLAFQANLIRGGLLLDCAAQHNFIDMNGIEQSFNLLATAMNNEHFSTDDITHGNMDRRNLVPLLEPHETMENHSQFRKPPPSAMPAPPVEPDSPFSWCYFRFSAEKLSELKAMAIESGVDKISVPYISTNDAVTAFCWQRVISVRFNRRQTPHAIAKFCRAVDARKVMGVPRGYMGDLITIAHSRMPFQWIVDASLPAVASLLREDLNKVNTRDFVRSFATFINNTPDKSKIVYGGKFNPDTDIGSSSWAGLQLSHVNFGLLGKPALVRRPNFGPLMSDIYLMPQTAAGDIDALLCFNAEDMEGLRSDPQWTAFADHIG